MKKTIIALALIGASTSALADSPNWDKIQNSQPNDTIGEINPKLVDKLIETLNQPKSLGSLLDYYSIDSSWHLANKDRLIHNWLNTYDNSEKLEKEYAKYILNDF